MSVTTWVRRMQEPIVIRNICYIIARPDEFSHKGRRFEWTFNRIWIIRISGIGMVKQLNLIKCDQLISCTPPIDNQKTMLSINSKEI